MARFLVVGGRAPSGLGVALAKAADDNRNFKPRARLLTAGAFYSIPDRQGQMYRQFRREFKEKKMHQIKRFKTLSAATAGDVDASNGIQEIFLHRQGTSSTFYGGLGNGTLRVSITLQELAEGVSICCDSYSEADHNKCMESRTFASGILPNSLEPYRTLNPVLEAEIYISNKLGVKAKISATRLAYMYDGIVRDDVIFSPFVYEASTDTIRSAVENYCVVYFTEGKFEKPNFDMDRAADIYQPFIAEALKKGFHECDRKRGDDYCKRRLAWIAGEYAKRDILKQRGEIKVGILTSLMGWPRSI